MIIACTTQRFFILTRLRRSLSQFTRWKQGKIHKNRSKKAIIYNILLRDFAVSNAEKVLIALLNTKQSVPSRHCLFGDCSKIKSKWRDLWRASVKLKRSFFFFILHSNWYILFFLKSNNKFLPVAMHGTFVFPHSHQSWPMLQYCGDTQLGSQFKCLKTARK